MFGAEELLPAFGARELANCMWALAKLGYQPVAPAAPAAGHEDRAEAKDGMEHTDEGGYSRDRDGRHSGSSIGLLQGLCQRAAAAAGQFQAQEVANSLWALGTLGKPLGSSGRLAVCVEGGGN